MSRSSLASNSPTNATASSEPNILKSINLASSSTIASQSDQNMADAAGKSTPRSTVAASLDSLQKLAVQPLTPTIRDSLSRLIQTLKGIQQQVRSEQVPREKLRDLYDEACSQAGTLRFEIASSYKDSPELRDLLLQQVQQCHDLLKSMYKALCDRLSIQVALESLRDLKSACVSVTIACRDSLLQLCERVIDLLGCMLRQVPGYTVLKQLYDNAQDALYSLKKLLLGETGLAEGLKKRLLSRIELASEYLNAVKDRLIKSQSLSLALDTLEDIEKNVESLFLVGRERVEVIYKDSTSSLLSGYKHGHNRGQSLVQESTQRVQVEFQRQKDLFVHDALSATRARIKDFQQEMLIVNDLNLEKLQEKYEDCFFGLQEMSQAEFLDFPDALLPEQVALLRKKIAMVGEYLQETVSRNHLSSTFFTTSARYLQSVLSLKKALSKLQECGSSVASMVPFSSQISTLYSKGLALLKKILLFEQIKGLLPVTFVSNMFRKAFEVVNNLRVTIQSAMLAAGGKVLHGMMDVKDFVLERVSQVCSILYSAQQQAFTAVYNMSLDAAITADRIFGVMKLAEILFRRAKVADKYALGMGTAIVGKGLALDRCITGGKAKNLVVNALEDYELRGGRALQFISDETTSGNDLNEGEETSDKGEGRETNKNKLPNLLV
ncbi:unnamed protein product [Amoebophrya sp. A120]|nr:unnamed protein product [Amoebophrya sp. A120]|eukprot:GSA120T00011577001.1